MKKKMLNKIRYHHKIFSLNLYSYKVNFKTRRFKIFKTILIKMIIMIKFYHTLILTHRNKYTETQWILKKLKHIRIKKKNIKMVIGKCYTVNRLKIL